MMSKSVAIGGRGKKANQKDDPVLVRLGKLLRVIRDGNAERQIDTAKAVGITDRMLIRYENGQNKITAVTLIRLVDHFRIDTHILIRMLDDTVTDEEILRLSETVGLEDPHPYQDVIDLLVSTLDRRPDTRQTIVSMLTSLGEGKRASKRSWRYVDDQRETSS